MTELEALRRVAEAARAYIEARGMPPTWDAMVSALRALDALPTEATGEMVDVRAPKVVQIATLAESPSVYASVWYLLDDGSLWSQALVTGKWHKETLPPPCRVPIVVATVEAAP